MRVFRHYSEVHLEAKGGVVALGNFDGVHRGHQAVIGAAQGLARASSVPLVVMTFEPHPRAFFNPNQPSFRLTPFRIKAQLIGELGVDVLFMQHFDAAFAAKTAEEFVEDVLVRHLGAQHVVVGYDYVFGKGRGGNVERLGVLAGQYGFGLTVVPPMKAADRTIYSSTAVRGHLTEGRPELAAELLGRYWEVEGRVEPGDQRGRTLGFPTANLHLGEYQYPALGVYAVRAGVDQGGKTRWRDGVANFGRRPTFDDREPILETHLFDFAEDIYGRHLRVALIERLRPEMKFTGPDAVKAQIGKDCEAARSRLKQFGFSADPSAYQTAPAMKRAEP